MGWQIQIESQSKKVHVINLRHWFPTGVPWHTRVPPIDTIPSSLNPFSQISTKLWVGKHWSKMLNDSYNKSSIFFKMLTYYYSSTFVPVTSSGGGTSSSQAMAGNSILTLSASQLKPEQVQQCSHRCIRLQRGSSVDKLTSSEQNFFHEANEVS